MNKQERVMPNEITINGVKYRRVDTENEAVVAMPTFKERTDQYGYKIYFGEERPGNYALCVTKPEDWTDGENVVYFFPKDLPMGWMFSGDIENGVRLVKKGDDDDDE